MYRAGIAPLIILAIAACSALLGGGLVAAAKGGQPHSAVEAGLEAGAKGAVENAGGGWLSMLYGFITAAVPAGLAYAAKSRAHSATKDELAEAIDDHNDTKSDLVEALRAHNATLVSAMMPFIDSLPHVLPKPATPANPVPQYTPQQAAALADAMANRRAELRRQLEAVDNAPAAPNPTNPN